MSTRTLTAVVAVAVPLLLAGCGGLSSASGSAGDSPPAAHTITVVFTVHDMDNGVYCDTGGRGGYSDINSASPVTIFNGSNDVIATGHLDSQCVQPSGTNQVATWTARVESVPDEPFYQVEVSHRGKLTFSRAELKADGWRVTAGLGS